MDLRTVDLNLLVVFDAMARQRSVSRAAEALGLSQPATSAALARLRALFDDALFVRAGHAMEPTPRAQQLAPVVARVVATVQDEILAPSAFAPDTASRGFTLLTPDIGEVAFLPGVLRRLRSEAPQVRLSALSLPRQAAAGALEAGDAELAIGYFPDLQRAGFFHQALFKTSYACITWAGNTEVGERLTQRQYLAARHVVVRPDGREHQLDSWLATRGWQREVRLELAHFLSLLSILPDSDFIATVPLDIVTVLERHIPIRRITLPFKPPSIDVHQWWHRRMQHDAAHKWLRGVFYEVNRRGVGEGLR